MIFRRITPPPTSKCRIASALTALALAALASPASAQTDIINYDFEGTTSFPQIHSYAGTDATAVEFVLPGAGVGGSNGLILDSIFPTGPSISGVQISTVSNPNHLVTDPSQVNISFDLRDTVPTQSDVFFYFQTFSGAFDHLNGTSSVLITPTTSYQHYAFTLADLSNANSQVLTDPTVQLSWQLYTGDGQLLPNSLNIDNVRVSVPSPVAAVPELSSCVPLALGLFLIAPFAWTRRKVSGSRPQTN